MTAGSYIRYAQQSPRLGRRSDTKVTVTRGTGHQYRLPFSVQTENGFSLVFCVYGVDKGFSLPASSTFFLSNCVSPGFSLQTYAR